MRRKIMIRSALLILVVATCAAQAPSGAQATKTLDRPGPVNYIFDDDGGAVQVVPADLAPSSPKAFHGGLVMKSVQQVSIFLGSGWASAKPRSRRGPLSDLMTEPKPTVELQKQNIKVQRALPIYEDVGDLSKVQVNDLTIQRKLSELLQSHAIPAPTPGTVFVIYLAPEIISTIGGQQAGIDYAAYHNFVNLEAGEVFYAVVPFHENQANHVGAAQRALVEAALNPRGTGWY
jgi:hypothetical protein